MMENLSIHFLDQHLFSMSKIKIKINNLVLMDQSNMPPK
jgi:hypothetical protein